jgi:hypothetical protein
VATASFNSLAGNTTTNTIPPRLGQRIDGTIPIAAGGALSDVAIWNVILTAREMLELSLGRRAGTIRPESIVSYWPLGGTESPEPDLSVNANYGTLTGTKFAFDPLQMQLAPDVMPMMPMMLPPPPLRQKHFRFRTDTGAADATPTWGALEDTN